MAILYQRQSPMGISRSFNVSLQSTGGYWKAIPDLSKESEYNFSFVAGVRARQRPGKSVRSSSRARALEKVRAAAIQIHNRITKWLVRLTKQATVAAAVLANKVLQYIKKTAGGGLVFRTGIIYWQLEDFVIGSVVDTSHDDEHCERTSEPYKSQGSRMTLLAKRGLVDQTKCGFHVTACASNMLKRPCRSTLTVETYQMELDVEAADQL